MDEYDQRKIDLEMEKRLKIPPKRKPNVIMIDNGEIFPEPQIKKLVQFIKRLWEPK